jgi:gamma-glutamyltranspeptidase/glutathione hydrolase
MGTPSGRLVGGQLQAMGHNVRTSNGGAMGGYQSIMVTSGPNGTFYRAGSDHRKDGQAVAY